MQKHIKTHSADAAAMFAALDAMDLPVRDLNKAAVLQREYVRADYIREMLDTMRAQAQEMLQEPQV